VSPRRLFFALWPEPGEAARLRDAARALELAAGRVPAAVDLHVTLCFLGAVEEGAVAALRARAAAIRADPFALEFDTLEYWRRSRVLAATCSRVPAAAAALALELRASARGTGLTPDERPLQPHVTLVRGLGKAPNLLRLPQRLTASLPIAAGAFYLAQSQELEAPSAGDAARPRYTRLASWPLRPGDRQREE
jgi:2'-5' RNA ligase